MPQYNEFDEIGFDDVIEEEDGGFTLLPAGAYEFAITKITRGRYNGSDKVPACGEVNIEMKVGNEAAGTTTITERFFMLRKFEWKLSQFFLSIGLKKHGEPLKIRWNIEGMKGKCEVYVDSYTKKDGSTGQSNKIKKFYAYDENVSVTPIAASQPKYTQPAPQYTQPAYTQQYTQTNNTGWKPGAF